MLRPLRDEMGIVGGVRNLPWMFTATFVTLLVAQPFYGALVAKLPRARFIPIVYHFFVANLALFWLLLTLQVDTAMVARVFYVWVAVFSLFVIAVFWSFMADLFTPDQGKRLFGFIGAGGTAGALLGPVITIWLSVPLGPVNLLIAAMILIEAAVFCVGRLERAATVQEKRARRSAPRRQCLCRGVRAHSFALSSRHRRLDHSDVVLRDDSLFRADPHGRSRGAGCRRANPHFRLDRPRGEPAYACHSDLRHRAIAQALWHRRYGSRAAGDLCRRIPRRFSGADARGGVGGSGDSAVDAIRRRQSGSAGVLHGARAGRKIQSQELDRRGHLSRLRCTLRLGVRHAAGLGHEARLDRPCRRTGFGRVADPVGGFGTAQERRAKLMEAGAVPGK